MKVVPSGNCVSEKKNNYLDNGKGLEIGKSTYDWFGGSSISNKLLVLNKNTKQTRPIGKDAFTGIKLGCEM